MFAITYLAGPYPYSAQNQSGGGEIRTREGFHPTRPSTSAEETGFEPARDCSPHAFQACAFDHSATPPHWCGPCFPSLPRTTPAKKVLLSLSALPDRNCYPVGRLFVWCRGERTPCLPAGTTQPLLRTGACQAFQVYPAPNCVVRHYTKPRHIPFLAALYTFIVIASRLPTGEAGSEAIQIPVANPSLLRCGSQ